MMVFVSTLALLRLCLHPPKLVGPVLGGLPAAAVSAYVRMYCMFVIGIIEYIRVICMA